MTILKYAHLIFSHSFKIFIQISKSIQENIYFQAKLVNGFCVFCFIIECCLLKFLRGVCLTVADAMNEWIL